MTVDRQSPFSEYVARRMVLDDHIFITDLIGQFPRHDGLVVVAKKPISAGICQRNHFLVDRLLRQRDTELTTNISQA